MSPAHTDRNLLFGVLALQMDFIGRDELIAAMSAWVLDKSKGIGEILSNQGLLGSEEHVLLKALVEKHLARHDNDPEKSLAAVGSARSICQDLEKLGDAEVNASLVHLPTQSSEVANDVTTPYVSTSTFTGSRFAVLVRCVSMARFVTSKC